MAKVSIGDVLGGLNQVVSAIPVLIAAYELGYRLWKEAHGDGTFDEYNAHLLASSSEVTSIAGAWLTEHGWVQGADGGWYRP